MHKILLKEDAQPIRQQQRRLNSTILDMVKKKVTNLLVFGIIYPISDSQWVSSVQVVPKKSRMTIIKNRQDKMVLARIHNSWLYANSHSTCGPTQDYVHMSIQNIFIYKDTVQTLQCFEHFLEMHDQHLLGPLGGLHGGLHG
ncbi:hypothetical protein CR513_16532, partial [Mucuna pruriens]